MHLCYFIFSKSKNVKIFGFLVFWNFYFWRNRMQHSLLKVNVWLSCRRVEKPSTRKVAVFPIGGATRILSHSRSLSSLRGRVLKYSLCSFFETEPYVLLKLLKKEFKECFKSSKNNKKYYRNNKNHSYPE